MMSDRNVCWSTSLNIINCGSIISIVFLLEKFATEPRLKLVVALGMSPNCSSSKPIIIALTVGSLLALS